MHSDVGELQLLEGTIGGDTRNMGPEIGVLTEKQMVGGKSAHKKRCLGVVGDD